MENRAYSPADRLLMNLDQAVRTLFGRPQITERANPADDLPEVEMSEAQRDHAAGLMRVNHTGEVCAQALYQGQALTARLPDVRQEMEQAAAEEVDHLVWCEERLAELDSYTSVLNPLWYGLSFTLGAAAGVAGDRWSLGFVAETEKQVEGHLDEHLEQLPNDDRRTRAILEQMKADEIAHGQKAMAHGGARLPAPIRGLMKLTSKIMTTSVYRI